MQVNLYEEASAHFKLFKKLNLMHIHDDIRTSNKLSLDEYLRKCGPMTATKGETRIQYLLNIEHHYYAIYMFSFLTVNIE